MYLYRLFHTIVLGLIDSFHFIFYIVISLPYACTLRVISIRLVRSIDDADNAKPGPLGRESVPSASERSALRRVHTHLDTP